MDLKKMLKIGVNLLIAESAFVITVVGLQIIDEEKEGFFREIDYFKQCLIENLFVPALVITLFMSGYLLSWTINWIVTGKDPVDEEWNKTHGISVCFYIFVKKNKILS